MTAQRETFPIFVVFLGSRSVCGSFHFFGRSARRSFPPSLPFARFPHRRGRRGGWRRRQLQMTLSTKDGRREDGRTQNSEGSSCTPRLPKAFQVSFLHLSLGLSKTFFARRCRVLDKLRSLAQYQGVHYLHFLKIRKLGSQRKWRSSNLTMKQQGPQCSLD